MTDSKDLTDQTKQPALSKPETPKTPSRKAVFLMRAKGQSWEEFTEFCIKKFREAGLIKD